MKNILVVIGTRPEAIKLAPVIRALKASSWVKPVVALTGQHRDLVRPILDAFDVQCDFDLDVMETAQTISAVTARVLEGLDRLLGSTPVDAVIGQGDTASVLAASMASFFQRIPFAHVEAGLRTGNLDMPFPEEMNRVLTSRLAQWHFAPTATARDNLLREGVAENTIWVTGNTVIDALMHVLKNWPESVLPVRPERQFVLVTAHRRENLGEPLVQICLAVKDLAALYPELDFVIPVHPNPLVRKTVYDRLTNVGNVILTEPFEYHSFCWLMKRARLILSDSGGVQEEAPALGVPVLVLREETERPEAVAIGATRLVGTARGNIVANASRLLNDTAAHSAMAGAGSPYGNGMSAAAIVEVLRASMLDIGFRA